MKSVEPLAFQLVGSSAWQCRWVLIDTDTDEMLMFTKRNCEFTELCGALSGDSPDVKLVFDRNGLIRSYFKVFDSHSNTCVGVARCMKTTAHKIVEILGRNKAK